MNWTGRLRSAPDPLYPMQRHGDFILQVIQKNLEYELSPHVLKDFSVTTQSQIGTEWDGDEVEMRQAY